MELAEVFLKTALTTAVAFAGFIIAPLFFPFTLLTVVALIALPAAISAWRAG